MNSTEIIEELAWCDRWLTSEDKNSKWYREYLNKVNEELIKQTKL